MDAFPLGVGQVACGTQPGLSRCYEQALAGLAGCSSPVLVSGWVTSLWMSSFSEDRSSRIMSAGSVSLFLARKPAAL